MVKRWGRRKQFAARPVFLAVGVYFSRIDPIGGCVIVEGIVSVLVTV
jgi:hypothetical protein